MEETKGAKTSEVPGWVKYVVGIALVAGFFCGLKFMDFKYSALVDKQKDALDMSVQNTKTFFNYAASSKLFLEQLKGTNNQIYEKIRSDLNPEDAESVMELTNMDKKMEFPQKLEKYLSGESLK